MAHSFDHIPVSMKLYSLDSVLNSLTAFWRAVLGINLLYELALVFLLFQDLNSARSMMKYLDPNLGVPLPEKSYAENCDFTPTNVWVCCIVFPPRTTLP